MFVAARSPESPANECGRELNIGLGLGTKTRKAVDVVDIVDVVDANGCVLQTWW